jgi:hypothetical protein
MTRTLLYRKYQPLLVTALALIALPLRCGCSA